MAVKCILVGQTPNVLDGVTENVQIQLNNKQSTITANGVLKGDGNGNISAVDDSFVVYESITPIEATTAINADTLNGKTYDNIKDYVDKRILGNNLLENWYLGNPVNQREGYVAPPKGIGHLYNDAACTLLISDGTIDVYRQVTPVSTGNYSYSIDGGTYYVKASDVVPGYTGTNTYTIDRWMTDDTVTIVDGGVRVKQNGYYAMFYQYLENWLVNAIAGKIVTYSALTTEGLMTATAQLPSSISSDWNTDDAIQGDFTLDITKSGAGKIYIRFGSNVNGAETTIKAIKLELGHQQTLAHQENGVWVLNEIPDYGEQLRRCQRYYQRLKASSGYMRFGLSIPVTDTIANVFVSLAEEMRTVPVVNANGKFALYLNNTFYSVTLAPDTLSPYNAVLAVTGTNLPSVVGQLLAQGDPGAYIDFFADL